MFFLPVFPSLSVLFWVIASTAASSECGTSPSYNRFTRLYGGGGGSPIDGRGVHEKVINGEDVSTDRDWPWVVSIRGHENERHCTGAIVHKNWILAAAHCAGKDKVVGFGSRKWADQTLVAVAEVRVHPNVTEHWNNDIAVFRLSEPLEFNSRVKPICLSSSVKVVQNEFVVAAGWGFSFDYLQKDVPEGEDMLAQMISPVAAEFLSSLQESPAVVRGRSHCQHLLEDNDTEYICIGGFDRGMMGGDSGGALMAQRNGSWYHVGNAHTAMMIAAKNRVDISDQTFYTETSQYCDFIEEATDGDVKCGL